MSREELDYARCWESHAVFVSGGCAVLFLGPPLHEGALSVRWGRISP